MFILGLPSAHQMLGLQRIVFRRLGCSESSLGAELTNEGFVGEGPGAFERHTHTAGRVVAMALNSGSRAVVAKRWSVRLERLATAAEPTLLCPVLCDW